jgi:hypothetical protein
LPLHCQIWSCQAGTPILGNGSLIALGTDAKELSFFQISTKTEIRYPRKRLSLSFKYILYSLVCKLSSQSPFRHLALYHVIRTEGFRAQTPKLLNRSNCNNFTTSAPQLKETKVLAGLFRVLFIIVEVFVIF